MSDPNPLTHRADGRSNSKSTNPAVGQKFKSRIEALEQWRDAAKASTVAPLMQLNEEVSTPTDARNRVEQNAVPDALGIHSSAFVHSCDQFPPRYDPNTPPEDGNDMLVSEPDPQASTLTRHLLPESSLNQEPAEHGDCLDDLDQRRLFPTWGFNGNDIHAIDDISTPIFQPSVQNEDVFTRSPPIDSINEVRYWRASLLLDIIVDSFSHFYF